MFGKNAERIDTFNGKQLLEEMDHEMILTMTGGSLENAVGNLFQLMRKQIFQEISYPIVQMEAKEVYFDEVQVQKETERFMFLFMPREKMTFTITGGHYIESENLWENLYISQRSPAWHRNSPGRWGFRLPEGTAIWRVRTPS